jgi:hypothetical protein
MFRAFFQPVDRAQNESHMVDGVYKSVAVLQQLIVPVVSNVLLSAEYGGRRAIDAER